MVGDPGTLHEGDELVAGRIRSRGGIVTVIDADQISEDTAAEMDLVIVSSTASSAVVGSRLYGVTTPVWIAKPWSLDDMGMTGPIAGTDFGTLSGSTVHLVDESHELAGGFTESVLVTHADRTAQFGAPGDGATTIAEWSPTQPAVFVYETGDVLADGSAAAGCRLAWPVFKTAPTQFTDAGWSLFDRAVRYASGGCATN